METPKGTAEKHYPKDYTSKIRRANNQDKTSATGMVNLFSGYKYHGEIARHRRLATESTTLLYLDGLEET